MNTFNKGITNHKIIYLFIIFFTEFTGLPNEVLTKILRQLETQGKAEIIFLEENNGVKFFDS